MKHPNPEKLIDGLLPYCSEAFTTKLVKKEVKGGFLIANGVYRTDKGKPILPDEIYPATVNESVQIDHRENMLKIIEKAKDDKSLNNQMAAYLFKYKKPIDTDKL